jgi:hypothetical protein
VNPRARSRARRHLVRATAWAATVVAVLLCALGTAAGAAAGPPPGRPAPHGASGLTLFRVDVSHYPQVGLVVTVPGAPRLARSDFRVIVGQRAIGPWVRQLSPDDIELALAPDAYLSAAGLRVEQAAATSFLVDLPAGADRGGQPVLAGPQSGQPGQRPNRRRRAGGRADGGPAEFTGRAPVCRAGRVLARGERAPDRGARRLLQPAAARRVSRPVPTAASGQRHRSLRARRDRPRRPGTLSRRTAAAAPSGFAPPEPGPRPSARSPPSSASSTTCGSPTRPGCPARSACSSGRRSARCAP